MLHSEPGHLEVALLYIIIGVSFKRWLCRESYEHRRSGKAKFTPPIPKPEAETRSTKTDISLSIGIGRPGMGSGEHWTLVVRGNYRTSEEYGQDP